MYGLSADGTVISGTVTDYTKIASTDTAWGTAGKETWYVADGIVNIITTTYDYDNNKNVYNPVEIKGNVNTQEQCRGKCSERYCRHRCNNNFL